MEPAPYSNREIDEKFKNVLDKMDEHFEATTDVQSKILEQTTKTNGSVASVKGTQKWQQGFMYGLGLFVLAIVIPILGYVAILAINNNAKLSSISATVRSLNK